ncbi:MAG: capsular biosynthesis protein [Nitrospirota bacterium]|nr:capsular biosynthesis protein [Nitrospirota bacterium]
MIDLHCHILPGIDDGPATMGESLDMCRIAYEDGIRTIVATPHFMRGEQEYLPSRVRAEFEALVTEVCRQGIGIDLLLGADVAVTPETPLYLRQVPQLTLNGTGRYFLAELPHEAVPLNWDRFLLAMAQQGMVPILTHPERHRWFLKRPDALYDFVGGGGLVQVTAMSLTGENGEEVRRFCCSLLQRALAHVIATDAHAPAGRAPLLAKAVDAAARVIGAEEAYRMASETPRRILRGEMLDLAGPRRVQERVPWYRRLLGA